MTSENLTDPIESYDPLQRLLTNRLRISPVKFAFIILLVNIVVDAWIGFYYKVFFSPIQAIPGLLNDWRAYTFDLVTMPVVCGIYLWTTVGATDLFRELQQSQVVDSEHRLATLIDKSRKRFRSKKFFFMTLAFGFLISFAEAGAYLGWVPWKPVGGYHELALSSVYVRAPFWFLTLYAVGYALINVSITVYTLREIFREQRIKVLPLHPDGGGGLGFIGKYQATVAWGIGAVGLEISVTTIMKLVLGDLMPTTVLFYLLGYAILAPLLFFSPLGTAHTAMQEAKEKELLTLARKINALYEKAEQKVDAQDGEITETVEKIEYLNRVYARARDFPVWPFNFGSVRRFFAIVTAPIIPALVSAVVEIITK